MYLCGPLNGISIHCISESIGRTYGYTCYMMRGIMDHIRSMQEKALWGGCETGEMYMKAASKGVPLEANGEDRTLPSRRALPGGPGRGTFEKNTPMINVYRRRATGDERDWTIFDVPRGGKSFAGMVQNRIKKGSKAMTDERPGYKKPGEAGYGHAAVNHSEGEYASGPNNVVQLRVPRGPAEVVDEQAPWRQQVASGIMREGVPVRTQSPYIEGWNLQRFMVTLAALQSTPQQADASKIGCA